jgi:hypothetical protein
VPRSAPPTKTLAPPPSPSTPPLPPATRPASAASSPTRHLPQGAPAHRRPLPLTHGSAAAVGRVQPRKRNIRPIQAHPPA